MNPLLYKAHPLLQLTVDLAVDPAAHRPGDYLTLLLIYLVLNLPWAVGFRHLVHKLAGFNPPGPSAYGLAFPSLLCFLPILVTLLDDVLHHAFRFADRAIFLFVLFVAVQMLTVFHGVLVTHPRNATAIGLAAGFTLTLALLLCAFPLGLLVLALNAVFHVL